MRRLNLNGLSVKAGKDMVYICKLLLIFTENPFKFEMRIKMYNWYIFKKFPTSSKK